MGIQNFEKILSINDLVKDDVIFSCTGVTNGDLVEGIKKVKTDLPQKLLCVFSV